MSTAGDDRCRGRKGRRRRSHALLAGFLLAERAFLTPERRCRGSSVHGGAHRRENLLLSGVNAELSGGHLFLETCRFLSKFFQVKAATVYSRLKGWNQAEEPSSHPSIVKEVSEFILKRIDHKSPIVKQKALRLIKYAVGKSDAEFRREMQRQSVAVRQLLHYKGHPDPLKGDALNKSVRETAQATLSAIFSTDDSKPAPSEGLNKRIQGFGNTNYEMPSEEKKSFLSEVVGLGSASIKQGLSTLTQGHSQKKNDAGSYKGPNLQRSLTIETNNLDQYEKMGYHVGSQGNSGISKNAIAGAWGQESRITAMEATKEDSAAGYSESKTREDRLLETIVTSGGVRLQPTRDALQAFLVEALRVDAVALSHALEQKLQSPLWQVRMKAVCVLEAILRKDDQHFSVVASYFTENKDVVLRCSESPQASLREKANKVLKLLGEEQTGGDESHADNLATSETESGVEMPDLINTGTPNDLFGAEDSEKAQSDQDVGNLSTLSSPFFDDLFGEMC
ncbi:hypothetical protein Nepgr_005551 [Nepenthes gracilis]|uniref:VHS domain-containing protein n=1 Tax=Nepenthes gracilis TaxID=150966 RepID=A0AAD3S3C3_NEPGR|nr:hypothetical protein Nepgr_005551 [Nepenthes gracilis]